jgi:mannan endo-1,4-beta-mannosidase
MYGHQDDLMYGFNWWYEKDRSDIKEIVGDYPAVAGFELGHIELGSERSLDSVSFTQIAEQIKIHYKKGGVITLSWHLNNPFTMQIRDTLAKWPHGTAWDVSSKEVVPVHFSGGTPTFAPTMSTLPCGAIQSVSCVIKRTFIIYFMHIIPTV